MIALLPGESRALFPRLTDEMYDLRLSAARARLDRPLGAVNRLTVVDYFDSLDPLYVLALDDAERVVGALRLLPTTGVTMLNDAFVAASPQRPRIESPLIWEASRLTLGGAENSLDHAAFRRNRLNADDVIDSKSVERALREKPASAFSRRALAQAKIIDRTIGEIGVALNEIAQAAALTHLVGVFDSGIAFCLLVAAPAKR